MPVTKVTHTLVLAFKSRNPDECPPGCTAVIDSDIVYMHARDLKATVFARCAGTSRCGQTGYVSVRTQCAVLLTKRTSLRPNA
jgi:hypothetical protein